eukprot:m.123474 g.123474  ORF g.123474 m.123474 type:complete len:67 (+) comp15574_c0_seq4:1244-1444(+)
MAVFPATARKRRKKPILGVFFAVYVLHHVAECLPSSSIVASTSCTLLRQAVDQAKSAETDGFTSCS